MKKQMKIKQRGIVVLAMLMLMGTMLMGCGEDEDEILPPERRENTQYEELPPLPPRNPDGTLG